MIDSAPLYITVKVSAKRFIIAKRVDVTYEQQMRKPIARYEALTVPLSFADATLALAELHKHGRAGVPSASCPQPAKVAGRKHPDPVEPVVTHQQPAAVHLPEEPVSVPRVTFDVAWD